MSHAPRHHSLLIGALAVVALASGCAYGEMRQVVRAQFASELACPEVVVEPRKQYDEQYVEGQYRAKGCGVTRTYTCPADAGLVSYDENACTFVAGELVKPAKPVVPKSADDMADDEPPMMDEPMAEPEPEPTPAAKPKGKNGKVGPKPSGKFKVDAETDTSIGLDADVE